METELTKAAIAVPGSLGIILAIATFIFMAWLVRFVLKTNEIRESRLAGIIERDLAQQKTQLDRIETANAMQREEHKAILETQAKSNIANQNLAQILERICGTLGINGHKIST